MGKINDNELTGIREVIGELLSEYKNSEEEITKHRGMLTGLATGFYDLDYKTKGFQNGDLIILEGRKAMWTLGLALSIVDHVIMKEKVTTALFSLNLPSAQIAKRLLAIEMDNNAVVALQGPRATKDWTILEKKIKTLEIAPLFIDDNHCLSVEEIRRKCLNLKKEGELGFVVINNLQLLSCEKVGYEENIKKLVLSGLKNLASEINCPILVISEISSCEDKTLTLQPEQLNLDESDRSRQYADLVMRLYDNNHDKPDDSGQHIAELNLVKNHDESVGKVKLRTDLGGLRYKNLMI